MAEGLVFVRFSSTLAVLFTCLLVASCHPMSDACAQMTPQMLTNPCYHQELEMSTFDKPKVICGAEIPITVFATHTPPRIIMETAKADKYYTLIMVDPDAPNHKVPKYWLHWICLNIKGKDLQLSSKTFCGAAPAGYTPPTPPHGTGVHRYQFYVFEQKSNLANAKAPPTRAQFELIRFVNELGLCAPPAASFEFKTQAPKK